jgi:hypothetical protein
VTTSKKEDSSILKNLLRAVLSFCLCIETRIATIEIIVAESPKVIPIMASLDMAASRGQTLKTHYATRTGNLTHC